jgi:hypothetical protein
MGSVASDPRWDTDPSPSYAEMAAALGIKLPLTSPELPPNGVEAQLQLFWPDVQLSLLN